MGKRFLHNRAAVVTVAFVLLIALIGILAPLLAPHDPYVTDILDKFAPYSLEYPLGTDHLGRCVLSRLIYGIRPTLGLALLTMLGTIALGALLLGALCAALLLLLGSFMDMAPLITIMTPILLPVVTNPAIGMDPVHFGVVMIFNLAVGLCTPPVGSALFVGCAIGKTPIERTAKNMLPLYATMVIVLLLVTYVPDISLLLPRLLMGYGA